MRKVIYTQWVRGVETEEYKHWQKAGGICQPGEYIEQPTVYVEGTNCNIEKEGLFHGFFPATIENNDFSYGNHTEAIIETEDGWIIAVLPSKIRFIDKPEDERLAEFTKAALACVPARFKNLQGEWQNRPEENIASEAVIIAKAAIAELKKQKPCQE